MAIENCPKRYYSLREGEIERRKMVGEPLNGKNYLVKPMYLLRRIVLHRSG